MCEIEFRGKLKNSINSQTPAGTWIYGAYCPWKAEACICEKDSATGLFVDSETVGQYTGLKDKNGVKIFEGDIIRDEKGNINGPRDGDHYHDFWAAMRYEVFYDAESTSFKVRADVDLQSGRIKGKRKSIDYADMGLTSYGIKIDRLIVIGNIHDNPELLKREGGAE
jgi:uncharacterized phage protein (TIGR01671 family)